MNERSFPGSRWRSRLWPGVIGLVGLPLIPLFWLFATGAPGHSLAPLWGNPTEVTNAEWLVGILATVAAVSCLFRSWLPFLIAVGGTFMATAGLAATAIAAFATFSAIVLGTRLVRAAGSMAVANSPSARLALAYWLGKAGYLLPLALLSWLPVNSRLLHGLLLLLPLLILRCDARIAWSNAMSTLTASPIRGWGQMVGVFLLRAAILLLLVAVVQPYMDGDAMTMHMRIAKEIQLYGFWSYDASQYVFSVMPLGPQLDFSAMFLLGGIETVKAEYAMQMLAMLTLVACGLVSAPRRIGLAVAAILASLPMFLREVSGLYIEVTLCGLCLAATSLVIAAARYRSRELILLCLLCTAAAFACKLHGVFLALPVLFVACLLWWRSTWTGREGGWFWVAVALSGLTLGAFFYAIAWWKTGNPVFPFMNGVFHSPLWHQVNFSDARWTGNLGLDLPWRMTFQSSLFEESANGSMGLLIPFLALGLTGLICLPRSTWIILLPMAIGLTYLIGAGSQSQYLRYLLPGLVILCGCASFVFRWSIGRGSPWFWAPIFVVLLAANLMGMPAGRTRNGLLHIPVGRYLHPGEFRGIPSINFREECLNAHCQVADVLNASARAETTTLLLGCPYGAYFNGRVIYTTWHNFPWQTVFASLSDPAKLNHYLDSQQVTHVVIDPKTMEDRRRFLLPVILTRFGQMAESWGVKLLAAREDRITGPIAVPLSGCSVPEPTGIWTSATNAELAILQPAGSRLAVSIRPLHASIGKIAISIDGTPAGNAALVSGEIPVIIEPTGSDRVCQVTVVVERTRSPKDVGIGDDTRQLACFLSGIRIVDH